jgi:hypothetical protein
MLIVSAMKYGNIYQMLNYHNLATLFCNVHTLLVKIAMLPYSKKYLCTCNTSITNLN